MSLFALVHGGAHGGWCWELLVPELEKRGHTTVAPDLPIEERRRRRAGRTPGLSSTPSRRAKTTWSSWVTRSEVSPFRWWRNCARSAAWSISAAQVPAPGMSNLEYLATEPGAVIFAGAESLAEGEIPDEDDQVVGWERAKAGFYHDVDDEVARQAWERFRHQSFTVMTERTPLEVWPDVPSTYILMKEDRAVGQEWSRRRAKEIGADLIEMEGSHSPFYSRPGRAR